jgi:hypothetical protein
MTAANVCSLDGTRRQQTSTYCAAEIRCSAEVLFQSVLYPSNVACSAPPITDRAIVPWILDPTTAGRTAARVTAVGTPEAKALRSHQRYRDLYLLDSGFRSRVARPIARVM